MFGCIGNSCTRGKRQERVEADPWIPVNSCFHLPEEVAGQQLLASLERDAWGRTECACLLLNSNNVILGFVGSRGISALDGLELEPVPNGVAVSFCPARLDANVMRLLLFTVAESEAQLEERPGGGIPANSAGPGVFTLTDAGPGAKGANWRPEHPVLCRMSVKMPPCRPGAGVLLAALDRCEGVFRLHAIGKAFELEARAMVSGLRLDSLVDKVVTLAHDAGAHLRSGKKDIEALPSLGSDSNETCFPPTRPVAVLEPWVADDLVDELSAATKLAEGRRMDLKRCQEQNSRHETELAATLDAVERTYTAERKLRSDLDTWHKQAAAAKGGSAEVATTVLGKFPAPVDLSALQPPGAAPPAPETGAAVGKAAELEGAKVTAAKAAPASPASPQSAADAFTVKRYETSPSTVGATALPEMLHEEDPMDMRQNTEVSTRQNTEVVDTKAGS